MPKENITKPVRSKTPEYRSWNSMTRRCGRPTDRQWKHYGGRGIKVCERWLTFANFVQDMGPRPANRTLDRKDNDSHYSCGKCNQCHSNGWVLNCRWASQEQQQRNRRNNHHVTFKGKTRTIAEWSAILKFPRGLISKRLLRGWAISDALETPALGPGRPDSKLNMRPSTDPPTTFGNAVQFKLPAISEYGAFIAKVYAEGGNATNDSDT